MRRLVNGKEIIVVINSSSRGKWSRKIHINLAVLCVLIVFAIHTRPIKAGVISGTVTSASNNEAITLGAATVVRQSQSQLQVQSAKLTAEGKYILENLVPGFYQLIVRAEGYSVTAYNIALKGHDEYVERDFTLEKCAFINGSLSFSNREPLAGAIVRLSYAVRPEELHILQFHSRIEARSNLDGKFSIPVQPGSDVRIQAFTNGRQVLETEVFNLLPGETLSSIELTVLR